MSLVAAGAVTGKSVQAKPVSILQVDEHPSPPTVFPSSHSSSENLCPSPQGDLQLPLEQSGSKAQW
jgi:hypothetical protein